MATLAVRGPSNSLSQLTFAQLSPIVGAASKAACLTLKAVKYADNDSPECPAPTINTSTSVGDCAGVIGSSSVRTGATGSCQGISSMEVNAEVTVTTLKLPDFVKTSFAESEHEARGFVDCRVKGTLTTSIPVGKLMICICSLKQTMESALTSACCRSLGIVSRIVLQT